MNEKKIALIEELHRPARKNYPRRHVDVRGLDETWQADLVDLSAYTQHNNSGYKYLLTIIDIFSKFAWAVPIKSKNAKDTTNAMKSVLARGRIPKLLHVDQGKEFYNNDFKSLMQQYNIKMYSTFSNLKASICERFNRTLKSKMWKKFSLRGTYKWVDILPDLISDYNDSKHRTIQMKPKNVTIENEKKLLTNIYGKRQLNHIRKIKFRIGDKVRVSKYKHVFEKGYTPNWTTEIFTINKIQHTNPVTYKLVDYQNKAIEGGFYQEEFTGVADAGIYLVEKVLQKRGNKLFVKWLGFDDSHNSWINKFDM